MTVAFAATHTRDFLFLLPLLVPLFTTGRPTTTQHKKEEKEDQRQRSIKKRRRKINDNAT